MSFSRRSFSKLIGLGLGSLAFRPWRETSLSFGHPEQTRVGRVLRDGLDLKLRPDPDSQTLMTLAQDSVVPWLREIVGPPPIYQANWHWLETPAGYLYAPEVQPAYDLPQSPLTQLPEVDGVRGMWAEVCIPYVNLKLHNPPARAPWLKSALERGVPPRMYYSQVIWVDEIREDPELGTLYRINERYGYGDIFWAAGGAFRPLTADQLSPIHPEVEEKRIVVDNTLQRLSCLEGEREVYFCTVSTGVPYSPQGELLERSSTPLGPHPIWRKMVSTHMSGGTTGGGWDLMGVGWTSLFVAGGIAIHSTFWHNNFGVPMSRGCVNARPEDARWIFRWTQPIVPYHPGDVTVSMPGGTWVEVIES